MFKKITFETATQSDASSLATLVRDVSQQSILPYLESNGQNAYVASIQSDINTVLNRSEYQSVKASIYNKLIGFAAMREGNYITHLFVDNQYQATGVGKALLTRLMATSHAGEVRLKASLNAVSFYESQGFVATGSEMSVNGIRFVPMVWHNTQSK
ncbi:MAG: GNAT family N-acetyltransferase [Pseudomonadota bacterium]|nr:GNAT family N-acetyltransferase [Pseudomonadota bacterium]